MRGTRAHCSWEACLMHRGFPLARLLSSCACAYWAIVSHFMHERRSSENEENDNDSLESFPCSLLRILIAGATLLTHPIM
eukprot:3434352-Amphidinium_carterae.1